METEGLLRFLKPLVEQSDASVYQIKDYCELLLTTPFTNLQNNAAAFHYAQKAVLMTKEKDPPALDLLAQAYAKKSDFATALAIEEKAIALLPPADPIRGPSEVRKTLELNRAGFRSGLRTSADTHQASR